MEVVFILKLHMEVFFIRDGFYMEVILYEVVLIWRWNLYKMVFIWRTYIWRRLLYSSLL